MGTEQQQIQKRNKKKKQTTTDGDGPVAARGSAAGMVPDAGLGAGEGGSEDLPNLAAAATPKAQVARDRRSSSFLYWLFVCGAVALALSSVTAEDVAWLTWAAKRIVGVQSAMPTSTASGGGTTSHKGCPFHFGGGGNPAGEEPSSSKEQEAIARGAFPSPKKGRCPFHSSKGAAATEQPPTPHGSAVGEPHSVLQGEAEHPTAGIVSEEGHKQCGCKGGGKKDVDGGLGLEGAAERGLDEGGDKEEDVGGGLGVPLLWMAPFYSGGGYCSEAVSFAEALAGHVAEFRIMQHGDALSWQFRSGLPDQTVALLDKLVEAHVDQEGSIVVCHSEPGAWNPPLYQTPPCPSPLEGSPLFVVGRTMFETDRVNPTHVKRINRMDEVWVPTRFHVDTFVKSGVDPAKVVVVPQAVDISFFSPDKAAIDPPFGRRLFGPAMPKGGEREAGKLSGDTYVFLSIFKWELRKGWDVLIRAFLQEFSAGDNVTLYLLTNAYHTDRNFGSKIRDFVRSQGLEEPAGGWPALHVCGDHIPQADLPGMYKRADAFVLPSRGEGWGRPHVEAMAMGLPVIATNWSGMTEYMTEHNSYPLPIAGMSEVEDGPFKGHLWANPSVEALQHLMRHVYTHREEGLAKGRNARKDMLRRFSPKVVARKVLSNLKRIENLKGKDRVSSESE